MELKDLRITPDSLLFNIVLNIDYEKRHKSCTFYIYIHNAFYEIQKWYILYRTLYCVYGVSCGVFVCGHMNSTNTATPRRCD